MWNQLSTTFQKPRKKAELLKLTYGNSSQAIKNGQY